MQRCNFSLHHRVGPRTPSGPLIAHCDPGEPCPTDRPLLAVAILSQPQPLLPAPPGVLGHGRHHSYENAFIKEEEKGNAEDLFAFLPPLTTDQKRKTLTWNTLTSHRASNTSFDYRRHRDTQPDSKDAPTRQSRGLNKVRIPPPAHSFVTSKLPSVLGQWSSTSMPSTKRTYHAVPFRIRPLDPSSHTQSCTTAAVYG